MDSFERQCIAAELVQLREEGCDVTAFEQRVEEALSDESTDDAVLVELYDALEALSPDASFPYEEPSDLEGIRALRPDGPRRMDLDLSDDALRDRILGAWLGRAAGCQLGKPVEGWLRERIDKYLESVDALPLDNYIPYTEGAIHPRLKASTLGNFDCMARDDDMDYPILGLLALERHGADLTARDMANTWLDRMPFHFLYTAERVAYRNFVTLRWPPESAAWRNPYREWIGAQIRADIFGYVAPGWPEKGGGTCVSRREHLPRQERDIRRDVHGRDAGGVFRDQRYRRDHQDRSVGDSGELPAGGSGPRYGGLVP